MSEFDSQGTKIQIKTVTQSGSKRRRQSKRRLATSLLLTGGTLGVVALLVVFVIWLGNRTASDSADEQSSTQSENEVALEPEKKLSIAELDLFVENILVQESDSFEKLSLSVGDDFNLDRALDIFAKYNDQTIGFKVNNRSVFDNIKLLCNELHENGSASLRFDFSKGKVPATKFLESFGGFATITDGEYGDFSSEKLKAKVYRIGYGVVTVAGNDVRQLRIDCSQFILLRHK